MAENIRQRRRLDESNDQLLNEDEQAGRIVLDQDDHRIRQRSGIPFS